MKKIIPFAAVILMMTSNVFAQKSTGKKILPYPISQKELTNGLNVVAVHYNSPGLAALYIVIRAGSRDEIEPGKTGFAHFFEHMMFRGTDKFPSEKYGAVLKSTGASANANTSLDRTVFHMTGNAAKLATMFELEGDRFQNLKYSVQDFKTEAGAVKGEYTKGSASPYFQLDEKISETAFNTHTYGHTTMGYFKDVVDMPNQYDYSLEFFKRFYRPEYATIIVVGDVQPAEVNALAQKYFGKWKHGNYVPKIPAEPTQTATRYTHIKMAGFPPLLSLNYKAPAFSDTKIDIAALDILSTILFSEKGDLYKKLVLDEQKVRFIQGEATDSRDPNLFSINASVVKAADLQYVKDEIVKTLDAAKTNKVDAQILADTKSRLRNSFAMSIDNATSIAESLSHYMWLTGDPESLNKFYAMYEKVTAEDLMNVAKKYFISTALTVATISPSATIDVK